MKYFRIILPLSLCPMALCSFAQNEQLEKRMLSHVEKIVVIDSINVDKNDFLSRYRIRPSAGRILEGTEVDLELGKTKLPDNFEGEPFTGFTNEFRDYMIWAQEDTTGYLRLAESVRLSDGVWSEPEFTSTVLNFGEEADPDEEVEANAAFPFMLDDGQTLYFAADNEHSLGGFDIFIATKDPSDGSFLIPGNIGMPFNSPYDDYMMVLDRQTGVGWWATDRNQLEDMVTIYIYAISDERVNVDPSDENLMGYATLLGWQELQDEEAVELRDSLLKEIRSIKPEDTRAPEFELPVPGGAVYRYFSDFKNRKGAELMKRYLQARENLDRKKGQLAGLREQYFKSGSSRQLVPQIQSLEQEVRTGEKELKSLLSEVYKNI